MPSTGLVFGAPPAHPPTAVSENAACLFSLSCSQRQELEPPSLLTKSSALLGLLNGDKPAEWWASKTAVDLNLPSPITVGPMMACADAVDVMTAHGIDQLPVVDSGVYQRGRTPSSCDRAPEGFQPHRNPPQRFTRHAPGRPRVRTSYAPSGRGRRSRHPRQPLLQDPLKRSVAS